MRALVVALNLRSEVSVEAAFERVSDGFREFNVLVNNAGIVFRALAYLASSAAKYITGQTLILDSGLTS